MSELSLPIDLAPNGDINETINNGEFTLLPEGAYTVALTEGKIEEKTFSSGAEGAMSNLKFEVTEGPHKGSSFLDFTVIMHNRSPDAARLGQAHIATLCAAAKSPRTDTLEHCVGVPVMCEIIHEVDKRDNKKRQRVNPRSFREVEAPTVAAKTVEAPADGESPSWMQE